MNLDLLELIRAKREWSWKPSVEELKKGFRGWHQRGYLPHFDAPNVTQMVTFMLADSFPVERRAEWESFLKEGDDSEKRRKLEEWLDRGHGECWLRRPDVAQLIEQVLVKADGRNYRMQAWVVMPNHVHLVVDVWDVPLVRLVNGWKGKSSHETNKGLGRHGQFWQEDYFDTLVRDAEHLRKAIRYTEQNPVRAFLAKTAREWPWSSARCRDQYERLPWQSESQARDLQAASAVEVRCVRFVPTPSPVRKLKRRERRAPRTVVAALRERSATFRSLQREKEEGRCDWGEVRLVRPAERKYVQATDTLLQLENAGIDSAIPMLQPSRALAGRNSLRPASTTSRCMAAVSTVDLLLDRKDPVSFGLSHATPRWRPGISPLGAVALRQV